MRGTEWEPPRGPWRTIFEHAGAIVAVSSSTNERIRPPTFHAEPVPTLQRSWEPGEHLALIGQGLLIARDLAPEIERAVHRLARTLASQEIGARWCVIEVPLPGHPHLGPAAMLQQIAFGAVHDRAVSLPIRDGYWPLGVLGDHAILVRENAH